MSVLRHAMFGMGDSSHAQTYSRGSENSTKALTRAGARRVGEHRRDEACGPADILEAARLGRRVLAAARSEAACSWRS